MIRLISCLILLAMSNSVFSSDGTYNSGPRSVSNWKSEAYTHLDINHDSLKEHRYKRCIKLNNYWCLKDVGWNGGVGRDSDNHTAFKNGYFSARAAVRNFRTAYTKHTRKSALDIMIYYAPTTDCVGSNGARRPDGICIYGNNNSKEYAKLASKGITDDVNQDLKLFDSEGKATNNLILFLENVSAFETGGIRVLRETIEQGICMEDPKCETPYY